MFWRFLSLNLISKRFVLRVILICLFPFVLAAWVYTFYGWYLENGSFEVLNVILSLLITSLWGFISQKSQISEDIPLLGSITESQVKRSHQWIINVIKKDWIESVIESSPYHAVLVELGLSLTPEAVRYPWSTLIKRVNQKNSLIQPGTKFLKILEDSNDRLLVLGSPGSGKTTLIVQWANELVRQVTAGENHPIPVILNLGTWSERYLSLFDWICSELKAQYHISRPIARILLERADLALFLDSLDEVRREYQPSCVRSINQFAEQYIGIIVVACRSADNKKLHTKLAFRNAVTIQPLSMEQVEAFLQQFGNKSCHIKNVLTHDQELQALARIPLFLNVLCLTYLNPTSSEIPQSTGTSYTHIFENYVAKAFEKKVSHQSYSKSLSIQWLSWIAFTMRKLGVTVFMPYRLNAEWLPNDISEEEFLKNYRKVGTIFTMPLVSTVVMSTMFVPELHLLSNFLPLMTVVATLHLHLIHILELNWRETPSTQGFMLSTPFALLGICMGFATGSIMGRLILAPLWGSHVVFSFGRSLEILLALWFGIFCGTKRDTPPAPYLPSIGIAEYIRSALFAGICASITCAIAIYISVSLVTNSLAAVIGIVSGLYFGLLVGFEFGGKAVIRYYAIRHLLWKKGHIPKHPSHFLEHAVHCVLLRRSGGGYVFIHRLLLEYFVAREESLAELE